MSSAGDNPALLDGNVIGVIIPPPDVRAIVDKTATFVARNGKTFESRILEKNSGNSTFDFLKVTSPYHKYYISKVDKVSLDIIESKKRDDNDVQDADKQQPQVAGKIKDEEQGIEEQVVTKKTAVKVEATLKPSDASSRVPPPPYYFTCKHPTDVPNVQMEIIKITAIHTAIRGKPFLQHLVKAGTSRSRVSIFAATTQTFFILHESR